MLSSREVMQLENQRFTMSNSVPVSRQINSKPQGTELTIHNNNIPQSSNFVQGIGHISVSNTSTVPSSGQGNSSVYNGFYSSSTFNSINNFEASLQWLTESRMPNNSLLSDKNLNCSSHSTPSHSCCVNRLGGVDNIGLCSPLSGDSFRSGRDTVSYQTKPPALSVNVIDSVQNWFNLPPLPNQQYSSKYNDQNLNCSQMNLPVIEQTDFKQNDICLQIPDSYFEQSLNNTNNSNNKHINGNSINDLNSSKIPDVNDLSNIKGHNIGYQSMSREWKQPLQTAANYISSPTLFSSLSDSPDHYLYSLPPPTSTSSYCMVTDNIANASGKLQQNYAMQQSIDKQPPSIINSRVLPCSDQINHIKNVSTSQSQLHHQNSSNNNSNNRSDKTMYEKSLQLDSINDSLKINQQVDITSQNCNHNLKNSNRKYNNETHYSSAYANENTNNIHNDRLEQKLTDVSKETIIEINDETSSCSDESNIIVEESDETEEIDSVISIDEMKKTFMSEEPVELRCLVCNVKSSTQTPATHFIHMNDSFPLTSASKTPVASKLIQILPTDLQHFLKLHNSFMCRRCLNLIETVEVLEVKLTSVKQTLSENFSKTVQYFLPATPILEIENGKAKIIDKEIIPSIEKSTEIHSSFTEDAETSIKSQKECVENNEMEEVEESEEERYEKSGDDDEEEEDEEIDENLENGVKVSKEESENYEEEGKRCSVCSKMLSSVKSYKKHMQLHTKCFSFYCEYCGKGYNLKNTLEKHIKLLHNGDNRYQCEKCGKTYSQEHRLDDHLKKHLGQFKISCNECGKGFMEKTSLELHKRSHTKEQPCVCEICGSKFVKEANLKAHLQICKKEEIGCNLCSEIFYSKTHLKKHEVTNHGAKPSTECNICGKAFVNVKDLKPHMRSHSQDKPFECKICGKRYKSVGNLNQHAKIHDINKLLRCTLCGEGFRRKKTLEDHMNKHSGERPYKCTDCSKAFFDLHNLQIHRKIHSGLVKKKSCSVCGKKFHHGLKVHMRTHTGVKPYVCNHCGQAFTVNNTLTRHIQLKHQNVLES
ncbi:uncharacterized protein LOC142329053 [Lycorma delicatula]|uniref:uncharacterized protein LOC142329053 n=1 Tax=Lycorma delicatula TaxID=130591 RepID=UPI003F518542